MQRVTLFLTVGVMLAFVAAVSSMSATMEQAYAFQECQNELNATKCGELFTSHGETFIPASHPPTRGRNNVMKFFASYFAKLTWQKETIIGEVIAVDNYVTFAKNITVKHKADGSVTSLYVVNWFIFDSSNPPLIQQFKALFNMTA